MSASHLFKVAVFCAAGFTAVMASCPAAYPSPRLGSEAGAPGPAGAHVRPGDPHHRRPSWYDWGTAAGAAAVGGMAGGSYYPQAQSYPASTPNCTDELQQEQGPYYNRIGQRRFCY